MKILYEATKFCSERSGWEEPTELGTTSIWLMFVHWSNAKGNLYGPGILVRSMVDLTVEDMR